MLGKVTERLTEFENRLVGGVGHGKLIPPRHGLRDVETNGYGSYRALVYGNEIDYRTFTLWVHEDITDSQALLWINDLVHLEDIDTKRGLAPR